MNHFVTLFNYNFLPQGLATLNSLQSNSNCIIWIVCLDEKVYEFLKNKNFNYVNLIPLKELENNMEKNYRKNRSFLEYCWMLTPFSIKYVLKQDPNIKQVTYIDADVFFYKNVDPIFEEFKLSSRDIFITEHGYHRDYNKAANSGLFCVQFLIIKNNDNAEIIRNEWEKKCIESTTIDYSKNIVGDQKYFDDLYIKYKNDFCVSKNLNFFQAPWTLNRFAPEDTIMYHFHSFRVLENKVQLYYGGYKLDENIIEKIYIPYVRSINEILKKNNLIITQTNKGTKEILLTKINNFVREKFFNFKTKRDLNKYMNLD